MVMKLKIFMIKKFLTDFYDKEVSKEGPNDTC